MHKGHGPAHAGMMAQLPHLNGMIALLRDGFNEQSQGGRVTLAKDGSPVLDYPMNDYLWEGVRHAYLAMAECQFAAGAAAVMPMHVVAGEVHPLGGGNRLGRSHRRMGARYGLRANAGMAA